MSLPDIQELQIGINNQFEFKKCTMKQFDKNSRRIDIYLLDSTRQIIEIPNTYVAKFQATKPDGKIVFDDCTITDNKITYIADEQLTTVYGEVECEIGLYEPDPSGDSKKDKLIQSKTFYVNVEKSAMDRNGIVSSDAFNTLTIMINSITGISADAEKAVQDMNTAISNVNQTNTTVTNAENIRVSNENTRTSNESTRVSSENVRISDENTRKSNETSRVNAESARVIAENSRVSNETTRQSQETTRQTNESIRQEFYNAYKVCEPYDNLKAYVVGNKVTYQGSTYQCIVNSTGIIPTNINNWILIAAKGIDGVGGDMKTSIYDPTGRNTDIFAHDTKDDTVTFAEATTESDITTGEKHSTLFGKILKSLKTIKTKIGDLSLLQTTSNTDLVGGINELKGSIDTNISNIGDKTLLSTADKSSLVNAINENTLQLADKVQKGDAVINVKYPPIPRVGAKGDGVTDDTAAIQNMINSLSNSGGKVFFPKGVYLITNTITIGNGTADSISTKHCIVLEGITDAVNGGAAFDSWYGSALLYNGATELPMIRILGAINSPSIKGITLNGNNKASHGLWATCALRGKFESVSIRDVTQIGILLDGFENMTVTGTVNNMYCTFRDLWVNLGNNPYATCIKLSGTASVDTNMSMFENLFLLYSGTSGRGLHLGYCDSNLFIGVHCFKQGTDDGNAYSIVFDGQEMPGYPNALTFLNFSATSDEIAYYGTVGNITFYNYMVGDGAIVPSNDKTRGTTSDGKIFGNWINQSNVLIHKNFPIQTLKVSDTSLTDLYKNATESADYGTILEDTTGNIRSELKLQNGTLTLNKYTDDVLSGSKIIATVE